MTLRLYLGTEITCVWGHKPGENTRIGSKTGAKHLWSCCIKAVTPREQSSPSRGLLHNLTISLTHPLQQQSIDLCLHVTHALSTHAMSQLKHTHYLELIHAQAPLSNNPPRSLHQLPPILLSPPLIRASVEIPHVMKALISTLWLQWGKVRGRKAVKEGGDYVFLHARLYRKTWHRISTATTAALFLNKWTGTFLFNGEPAALPAQNNHSTEHESSASFSLCAHTHYIMHICVGGNTPQFGNRAPIEYRTILQQTQGCYKSRYDLKNVPVCAVEMHD